LLDASGGSYHKRSRKRRTVVKREIQKGYTALLEYGKPQLPSGVRGEVAGEKNTEKKEKQEGRGGDRRTKGKVLLSHRTSSRLIREGLSERKKGGERFEYPKNSNYYQRPSVKKNPSAGRDCSRGEKKSHQGGEDEFA